MNISACEEFLSLVSRRPFDKERASVLLPEIGHIDQPVTDAKGYEVTFMTEAVDNNNLEAVRFLLERGADPNYISKDFDCPFMDLQFGWDDEEEDKTRYQIARLFLSYGADPNLMVEGETVFDSVTYSVYNDPDWNDWRYLISFYKLLVLFGGGGRVYEKPFFSEPLDLSRADEYQIRFRFHEDGYHIFGFLLNPDGKIIAQL